MALKVEIIDELPESRKCVLCLNSRDVLIDIYNEQQLDMATVLCCHFWFPPEYIRYQFVCRSCWNHVEEFHRFYEQVQLAYEQDGPKSPRTEQCYIVVDSVAATDDDKKTQNTLQSEWILRADEVGVEDLDENTQNLKAVESHQSCGSLDETDPGSLEEYDDGHHLTYKNTKKKLSAEVQEGDRKISNHCLLQCVECGLIVPTFMALMKHFRSTHVSSGYVECCGRRFNKRVHLLHHVVKQENHNSFSCEICSKTFSSNPGLQEHMMKHDPPQTKIFKCDLCDHGFNRRYQLNIHRRRHVLNDDRKVVCSVCQKTFLNERRREEHFKRAHGTGELICEKCPQRFKTITQFRDHQRIEHESNGKNRIECKVCKRWLKNVGSLRKHMYRHQTSNKPNVCDICGKNAPNAMALQSHKLFVHQKEKSYECSVCHKAFKRAFTLQEHMTTHTGNILYNCQYCSKTFNSSANMHAHNKKAHREEWLQNRKEYELQFECKTISIKVE